jgi:adenosylhomocysteine nucleosidase
MIRHAWGIIIAMEKEAALILQSLSAQESDKEAPGTRHEGSPTFNRGLLNGIPVVVAISGVGKTNAAIATQILIDKYNVDNIVAFGTAGHLNPNLARGDTVISDDVVHHDVEATALGFIPGEVPFLKVVSFKANSRLVALAKKATNNALLKVQNSTDARGHLPDVVSTREPRVIIGRILTGDQFISSERKAKELWQKFQGHCVDMESAAIAQTAWLSEKPFVIVNMISDKPGKMAAKEFNEFLEMAARVLLDIAISIIR